MHVLTAGRGGIHRSTLVPGYLDAMIPTGSEDSEDSAAAAERAFRDLMPGYLVRDDVSEGTGFGKNPGLRHRGHIFAMLVRDELVVKLAPARVTQLIAAGRGHAFDAGKGRPLRAWLAVSFRPGTAARWADLVDEAFEAARSS
jgi:hypothetical protein